MTMLKEFKNEKYKRDVFKRKNINCDKVTYAHMSLVCKVWYNYYGDVKAKTITDFEEYVVDYVEDKFIGDIYYLLIKARNETYDLEWRRTLFGADSFVGMSIEILGANGINLPVDSFDIYFSDVSSDFNKFINDINRFIDEFREKIKVLSEQNK